MTATDTHAWDPRPATLAFWTREMAPDEALAYYVEHYNSLADRWEAEHESAAALSRRVEELQTALREIHAYAKYPTVASIQVLFLIEELADVALAADPAGAAPSSEGRLVNPGERSPVDAPTSPGAQPPDPEAVA